MLLSPSVFFAKRTFTKQYHELFEEMAHTITTEYIQENYDHIHRSGVPFSFEEVMGKVSALNNELTLKAEWIREDYKEGKGYRSTKLTTGCKRIIKRSVENYLRQLKCLKAISRLSI
jgi:hypothetical protein